MEMYSSKRFRTLHEPRQHEVNQHETTVRKFQNENAIPNMKMHKVKNKSQLIKPTNSVDAESTLTRTYLNSSLRE